MSTGVVATTVISTEEAEDSVVVGGYLPDYRFSIDLNRTALSLTDLYMFSTDLNPLADPDHMFSHQKNSNLCCLDSQIHWSKAKQAKAYKSEQGRPKLNLWLTVGGAGRSGGLQKLFTTARHRIPQVAQALAQLCQTLGLHGIDIDYQQGLNRGVEMQAFLEFLQLLSDTLHHATSGPYLLSTTLRPGMWLPKKVYRVVDRIHVMTYDGTPHAPLENYVKPAIQACLRESMPPSKLILGIPAYARHSQNPNRVMTFAELYDKSQLDGYDRGTTTTDVRAEYDGFVFDSPEVVRQKAQYAKQMGLGGVFFWELGQDKQHEWFAPSGFLLQAAASVLTPQKPIQKQRQQHSTMTTEDGSSFREPEHPRVKETNDREEL